MKTKQTKFWYDQNGRPHVATTPAELSEFEEHFVHYLSDHLQTLDIDPDSDGLKLYAEFKTLYIGCLEGSIAEFSDKLG